MPFDIELSTDRLRLRPCTPADVDALYVLWRMPEVRRYLLDDQLVDREWVIQYIADSIQASARGLGLWVLELQPGSELAGFVSLREIEKTEEVEIYYGLAPQFWGKGLAQEASRALLRHGFEALGLKQIWVRTDAPNAASIRLAERLGMKPADDPGGTSLVSFVLEHQSRSASEGPAHLTHQSRNASEGPVHSKHQPEAPARGQCIDAVGNLPRVEGSDGFALLASRLRFGLVVRRPKAARPNGALGPGRGRVLSCTGCMTYCLLAAF